VSFIISGVQWIRTVSFSTFLSGAAEIRRPRRGSSSDCSGSLQYVPRAIITDKLGSYGVAKREVLPNVEHRRSRYLNNRAENSHRPTRRRERQMQRFKSPRQAQRFLSAPSFIYGHFRPRRHLIAAKSYREIRAGAFNVWQQEACARTAA